MNTLPDTRPSSELSNLEIVAYLFRAVRDQQLRSAEQVQKKCWAPFPDLDSDRQRECLLDLANLLHKQTMTA